MEKITPKQLIFAKEYIRNWNRKRAAIAAGYSEDSAAEIAHENLMKPHIAAAVAKHLEDRCEDLDYDARELMRDLIEVKNLDLIDLFTDTGTLKPVTEWPPAWRRYAAYLEVNEI